MFFDQSVKYWIMESIMNDRQANRTSVGTTKHMCHNVKKRTFLHVRPTKTQINLRIRAVWSESSLYAWRKLCVLGYSKCAKWIFFSNCANAQTDLKLRWTHMSEGTVSDILANLYFNSYGLDYTLWVPWRLSYFDREEWNIESVKLLNHLRLASHKMGICIGKQCRPRSDAAERRLIRVYTAYIKFGNFYKTW